MTIQTNPLATNCNRIIEFLSNIPTTETELNQALLQLETFNDHPNKIIQREECCAYLLHLVAKNKLAPEMIVKTSFFQEMRLGIDQVTVDVLATQNENNSNQEIQNWVSTILGRNIPIMKLMSTQKPRIRDLGIKVGIFSPGPKNAITAVFGVKVGHTTLIKDGKICTGVTAILPHGGNLFKEKVPGAVHVGNAFGKIIGSTQVNELGQIGTPIILTSTLSAPKVADALNSYVLGMPGNEGVLSVNPLVGETNDGLLNDGRSRPIVPEDLFNAINNASDEVVEGCVGAGTGTIAFGFKGGIGTASRKLPEALGSFTLGVLVQTNFGGVLNIAGVPVGKELGVYYLSNILEAEKTKQNSPDGSIMIVVATDAPVDDRNLKRLAARAMMGLARTGASGSNGSGDFVIAFSTFQGNRIITGEPLYKPKFFLSNDSMSPLFEAVIEATEEAILNSLFQAHDTTSNGKTVKALPLEKVIPIMQNYRAIT